MDINRQVETAKQTDTGGLSPNDDRRTPLSMGRSVFPEDTVARIFKPSRSVMTSGRARTKGWRLVFERRMAPFIEPLMGYTGGNDTLTQIDLGFPTLESANRYAERQGLSYVLQVQSAKNAGRRSDHAAGPTRLL